MGKPRRHIRPSQPPAQGKRLATHEVELGGNTNALTPIFRLEHLGGKYCLSQCSQEQKAAFADTLHRLGRMTWGEIQGAHRHGLGSETIERSALCVGSLPGDITEDDRIIAFRFHGKAPMVGFRRGRVFTVLFLDRDFTLYDHS